MAVWGSGGEVLLRGTCVQSSADLAVACTQAHERQQSARGKPSSRSELRRLHSPSLLPSFPPSLPLSFPPREPAIWNSTDRQMTESFT